MILQMMTRMMLLGYYQSTDNYNPAFSNPRSSHLRQCSIIFDVLAVSALLLFVFFFLGCPKNWLVNGTYCYKLTNYRPKKLNDAQKICQDMLADLPIIKSEQENVFIAGLMTNHRSFVRLGVKREKGKLLWFDGASAERSNTARYNAWADNQPSNKKGENCAYIGQIQQWNDNPCNYIRDVAPFVLCKKLRV